MGKIVILGCGNVGSDVARYIAEEKSAKDILVADYNIAAAEKLANEIGAQSVQFDATKPEDVKRVLEGASIVFNGVGPFHRFAIPIIEQAIASGVNYVDINDDYDVAINLISTDRFDEAAKKAGVTVVFGAGSTPGLTNVLARWGVDSLDKAESVNIAWGCSFMPNLSVAVVDHMFHCLAGDIPQFIDGKRQDTPAWSGEKQVHFEKPFDTYTAAYSGHAEPITLPHFIPQLKNATVRSTFFQEEGNEMYKQIIELGLSGNEKIEKFGISPREFIAEYLNSPQALEKLSVDVGNEAVGAAFQVEILGELDGNKTQIIYEAQFTTNDPTPLCGATVVLDVLNGKINQPGLFSPEGVVNPETFVPTVLNKLGGKLYRKVNKLESVH
ncbi:saccharopine dehydrogenase family protein [Paenibacillus sp. Y412MC10]|uniref:saccharopine dehydrogenase family protein n=1 Tax=Geobacillus sp. (strain Y412MC10) TaxID=481743 RepID=UPI0016430E9D|nr:saccharopine dehydrogenase NADP-binding domain-containing protein [Paenibacillus sp. Y412MC10]